MSYYKECPYCGSNLDPCESCDCQSKENASIGKATEAKGVINSPNKLHPNNTTKGGVMSSDRY